MNATQPPHTRWGLTLATAVGSAALVAVILLAFLWPTVTSSIHNLPVAVTGNGPAATALQHQMGKSGAFTLNSVDSRAAAVDAVEARKDYGALVIAADGSGVEVLTASAASPVAAQILNQVAASVKANPALKVTVTDVAPLNAQDPRGTGLALLGLPLAMGGMIGGVLISLVVTGFRRRLVAVGAYGVAGGLGLVAILQGWFGILSGSYLLNAAAICLGLFAIAVTIVGLESLLGKTGIPIGAVLTMFIGNPISSLTSPQEFLPGAWGNIGQWFVPGATGTLLRDLSYFPHAAVGAHWLVLAAWSAVGIILAILGRHRNEEAVHLPATLDTATPDGGGAHRAELVPAGR